MVSKRHKNKISQPAEICVLIPAYNEARTIEDVVRRAKKYARNVMVLDDGSTDATARLARQAGAEVIGHPTNRGKGAALQKGFRKALAEGWSQLVVIDGDGQHEPEEIPAFLRAAEDEQAAVVIGNRMGNIANMPAVRYYTNLVTSAIISRLVKQRVPDSQCGYRLIRREVLDKINFTTTNYDTESELLVEAGRQGFKICSVPIKSIYAGQESRIKPGKDTLRFIRLVLRSIIFRRRRNAGPRN